MKERKGWSTHRWSGWPGAFCILCNADDLAEATDDFPYPDDLENPTPEEDAAIKAWWAAIDAKQGECPANPERVDPYTLGGFNG